MLKARRSFASDTVEEDVASTQDATRVLKARRSCVSNTEEEDVASIKDATRVREARRSCVSNTEEANAVHHASCSLSATRASCAGHAARERRA